MASNFKMLVTEKGKTLRMKLIGDFDGTSAYQVIGRVHKRGKRAHAIYIDTSNIQRIYPFGLAILQSDLASIDNRHAVNLMFTGTHAAELAPKGARVV